jgi:hypothetical protein
MAETAALYAQVAGESWARVAEPVRCIHRSLPIVHARGCLRIEYGRHSVARFLARLLRLPRPGAAAEVRLTVTAWGNEEVWQRTFGGRHLDTRQYKSATSALGERFGPLEFRYDLHETQGSLVYLQREAAFRVGPVRLRIPERCAPRVEAREDPAGPGRVNVHVRVTLPGVGRLIAYDGTILVEDAHA